MAVVSPWGDEIAQWLTTSLESSSGVARFGLLDIAREKTVLSDLSTFMENRGRAQPLGTGHSIVGSSFIVRGVRQLDGDRQQELIHQLGALYLRRKNAPLRERLTFVVIGLTEVSVLADVATGRVGGLVQVAFPLLRPEEATVVFCRLAESELTSIPVGVAEYLTLCIPEQSGGDIRFLSHASSQLRKAVDGEILNAPDDWCVNTVRRYVESDNAQILESCTRLLESGALARFVCQSGRRIISGQNARFDFSLPSVPDYIDMFVQGIIRWDPAVSWRITPLAEAALSILAVSGRKLGPVGGIVRWPRPLCGSLIAECTACENRLRYAFELTADAFGNQDAWVATLNERDRKDILRRAIQEGQPHRPVRFAMMGHLCELACRGLGETLGLHLEFTDALRRVLKFRNSLAHGRGSTYVGFTKFREDIVQIDRTLGEMLELIT